MFSCVGGALSAVSAFAEPRQSVVGENPLSLHILPHSFASSREPTGITCFSQPPPPPTKKDARRRRFVVFHDHICCTAILLCVPKLAVTYLLPFAVFNEEINKRFISKHDSNISFLS